MNLIRTSFFAAEYWLVLKGASPSQANVSGTLIPDLFKEKLPNADEMFRSINAVLLRSAVAPWIMHNINCWISALISNSLKLLPFLSLVESFPLFFFWNLVLLSRHEKKNNSWLKPEKNMAQSLQCTLVLFSAPVSLVNKDTMRSDDVPLVKNHLSWEESLFLTQKTCAPSRSVRKWGLAKRASTCICLELPSQGTSACSEHYAVVFWYKASAFCHFAQTQF